VISRALRCHERMFPRRSSSGTASLASPETQGLTNPFRLDEWGNTNLQNL
jgi:hypothetical protein